MSTLLLAQPDQAPGSRGRPLQLLPSQRYRVCHQCSLLPLVMLNGEEHRFCQQVGRPAAPLAALLESNLANS